MGRKLFQVGMMRLAWLALGLAAVLAASGHQAHAQSNACRSIESELSSLVSNTGSPARSAQYSREASRFRAEAQRAAAAMAGLGCEQQQFLIFGSPAPPQCAGYRARIRRLQASADTAERAAAEAGGDPGARAGRRRELEVAYSRNRCGEPLLERPQRVEAPRPRGLLEAIFGAPPQQRIDPRPPRPVPGGVLEVLPDGTIPRERSLRELDMEDAPATDDPYEGYTGGGKGVCVRSCDGFFWPLEVGGGRARSEGDEICQAMCPGAETKVFFMAQGGDIQGARSASGVNYTELPGALRYRQSFDAGCSCKSRETPWAVVLKPVEEMVGDARRGDITITPERALEMARPVPPREEKRAPGKVETPATGATSAAAAVGQTPPLPVPPAAAPAGADALRKDIPAAIDTKAVRVIAPGLTKTETPTR